MGILCWEGKQVLRQRVEYQKGFGNVCENSEAINQLQMTWNKTDGFWHLSVFSVHFEVDPIVHRQMGSARRGHHCLKNIVRFKSLHNTISFSRLFEHGANAPHIQTQHFMKSQNIFFLCSGQIQVEALSKWWKTDVWKTNEGAHMVIGRRV